MKLLFVFILMISFNCFSQKRISLAGYQKIEESYTYADNLLARALPQVNNFYWEYRFRNLNRINIDSVFKLHGQKAKSELIKLRNTDYEVKQISEFRNKVDSLRIHLINSDQGLLACIPNGDCFHYLIYVKNDSVKIIDHVYALYKFILPINSYEKAILWSIWKDYNFSHTGYYKQQGNIFELLAERKIESRKLRNGKWLNKVAVVHLKINSSGEITETILRIRRYKEDYRIVV